MSHSIAATESWPDSWNSVNKRALLGFPSRLLRGILSGSANKFILSSSVLLIDHSVFIHYVRSPPPPKKKIKQGKPPSSHNYVLAALPSDWVYIPSQKCETDINETTRKQMSQVLIVGDTYHKEGCPLWISTFLETDCPQTLDKRQDIRGHHEAKHGPHPADVHT